MVRIISVPVSSLKKRFWLFPLVSSIGLWLEKECKAYTPESNTRNNAAKSGQTKTGRKRERYHGKLEKFNSQQLVTLNKILSGGRTNHNNNFITIKSFLRRIVSSICAWVFFISSIFVCTLFNFSSKAPCSY